MLLFAEGVFVLVGPLSLMLGSYVHILWAILKIQSKEGQESLLHLLLPPLSLHSHDGVLGPESSHREEQKKILSFCFTV